MSKHCTNDLSPIDLCNTKQSTDNSSPIDEIDTSSPAKLVSILSGSSREATRSRDTIGHWREAVVSAVRASLLPCIGTYRTVQICVPKNFD